MQMKMKMGRGKTKLTWKAVSKTLVRKRPLLVMIGSIAALARSIETSTKSLKSTKHQK